jgi:polysaccharide biosynthesis transport protein
VNNSIIPSSDAGYPAPGPTEEYAAPGSTSGLRRIVFFLRKLWWVPLLTLILAEGSAVVYLHYWAPPDYVSSASMWETEKLRLPEGAAFSEDLQNYLGNQMELMRSDGMQKRVVAGMQAANSNSVPLDKDGFPIAVKITVKQAPKSTIFTIEATTANPAYSQTFLDALLNEYREFKKNVRKTVSGDTLNSISEQVGLMETELKSEQAALTAFERTNNLAILQEEGTVAGGYLAKLQTELSDLKMESQLLDATADHQKDLTDSGHTNNDADSTYQMREFGSTSAPPASSDHLTPFQEIELLRSEREKLSQNLRPKHPKIVKLDAQIERDEKIIQMFTNQDLKFRHQNLEQSRERLAASRQDIKTKMENIVASIKEWEGKVIEANNRIAEAEHLKASVSRTQGLYDRLDTLLHNLDISRNIDQETLTPLEPASAAKRSYSDEIRLLAMSGIGGLCLGFGLIALVGIRDDRFNTIAEVSEKFGDVIVGQVPDMPVIQGKTQIPLLEVEDERDMYAESYRSLRSAIIFMPGGGERPKTLLITSAQPDEGKSTIALNLARTLALGGSRVVLIDADLRRGHLHELLGMKREPGLTDLLQDPENLEKILQSNCTPNLWFISCGWSVKRPGDLFVGHAVELVLARLRQQFDFVVIDTSPVFASDDVPTLAPRADGTLFVVRSRFSSSGAVKEALELLGQRQVRVLGLVFNRADASARSYYYYKDRAYHRAKTVA